MGNICNRLSPPLTKCKHLVFYWEKTALWNRVCLQNSLGGGGGGGYDHLADSLLSLNDWLKIDRSWDNDMVRNARKYKYSIDQGIMTS